MIASAEYKSIRQYSVAIICCLASSICIASEKPCAAVDGHDGLLQFDFDTVIFGELHGNNESPRTFLAAVCRQLQDRSRDVRIALEFPADMQDDLDVFFESDGSDEAIRNLLEHGFWQRRESSQDGRSSEAMLKLIRDLRKLAERNRRIKAIYAIDGRRENEDIAYDGVARDNVMASNVTRLSTMHQDDVLLVLVGNIHARRTPPSGMAYLKPMASLLDLKFMSVLLMAQSGDSWNCKVFCEEMPVAVIADVARAVDYHISDGSFDRVIPIGRVTSSPPAKTAQSLR